MLVGEELLGHGIGQESVADKTVCRQGACGMRTCLTANDDGNKRAHLLQLCREFGKDSEVNLSHPEIGGSP